MAEGRRYSFNDAMNRRARELEDELELQHHGIKTEARRQIADIQRAGTEARSGLDHAAERTNGIHWERNGHREAPDKTAGEHSAELERTGEQQKSALDAAMHANATELDDIASGRAEAIERASMEAREKFKQTAAAEARRIDERLAASHDAMRKVATDETVAFEESLRARLVELEDALRDQAQQTRDEMRRTAGDEAAAFDEIAGKRIAELQDTVREHSELLQEVTHLHASTAEQLEQARALAADVQRDTDERYSELDTATALASTPDLRGLDHQGRPVGFEMAADERFAELNGYVERSEAVQRAMEERIADLEAEVAESAEALEERVASPDPTAGVSIEQLEAALAATASAFEVKLRTAADEHVRRLEQAGAVTKNQLLDALARAEDGLSQAAEARATELGSMIAAARTTIEQAADSRVEGLDTAAGELRDGIEDLHRDIAAALTQSGAAQSAALERAAKDWLKRMDRNGAKGSRRRRAAPGAAAVVIAIAAALGGTMFFRGGGGGRPTVARADSGSPRPAVSTTTAPVDPAQVSDVANALSNINWPSQTAPLNWRAPGTSTPGTNGSSPSGSASATSPGGGGGAAPAGGGGGGGGAGPATPAPTQPPPAPPPSQAPPPTLLPPITVPLAGLPLPRL
ncbi:MAG TPA: hypothetical protein VGO28_05845 [Acidimicrobiia bacterium]